MERRDRKFSGKKYDFVVPDGATGFNLRQISVGHCRVSFPNRMDVGDNKVEVEIELADKNSQHPNAYALDSTDVDIAQRLAFKITGRDSTGMRFEFYPRVRGSTAMYRANSFADIILDGKSPSEIASTPRRFLYFHKGRPLQKGLEKFDGGGYTSQV